MLNINFIEERNSNLNVTIRVQKKFTNNYHHLLDSDLLLNAATIMYF
jgi:hypothetical protein